MITQERAAQYPVANREEIDASRAKLIRELQEGKISKADAVDVLDYIEAAVLKMMDATFDDMCKHRGLTGEAAVAEKKRLREVVNNASKKVLGEPVYRKPSN